MLNDYGKSLFKPWLSVPNAVLLAALLYGVALLNLASAELASWVQAVGSIAAIYAAFLVSRNQINIQREKDDRAAILRMDAIYSVVKNAADYGILIGDLFRDTSNHSEHFGEAWSTRLKLPYQSFYNSLSMLPAHELGSPELVFMYGNILSHVKMIELSMNEFSEGEYNLETYNRAYTKIDIDSRFVKQFLDRFLVEVERIKSE